jgi:hypothetical protein
VPHNYSKTTTLTTQRRSERLQTVKAAKGAGQKRREKGKVQTPPSIISPTFLHSHACTSTLSEFHSASATKRMVNREACVCIKRKKEKKDVMPNSANKR